MKVIADGLRLRAGDHGGQSRGVGLFHGLNAAEVLEQAAVVLAPTPGISSNSVERSRICRRLRWNVTAKRWASSRIIWTR